MKVKIGPYRNWFGPYQLAQALCFWAKKSDKSSISGYPEWVHKFGEWLAYGSVRKELEIGETEPFLTDDRKETMLHKFLAWIYSKQRRKIYVKLDPWDTFSMDNTLGHIILPMLKELKERKHSGPYVEDEDVPDHIKSTADKTPKEDEWDLDSFHFDRWDYVLDEMIFAFETKSGNLQDWESQFVSGKIDFASKRVGKNTFELIEGPEHTSKIDTEGRKEYQKRISNGFRLFGKYYESLWT